MKVQSGASFLNKPQGQKRSQKSSDGPTFEDALMGASAKKKPRPMKKKMARQQKKEVRQDLNDAESKTSLSKKETPKKKFLGENQRVRNTQQQAHQKQELMNKITKQAKEISQSIVKENDKQAPSLLDGLVEMKESQSGSESLAGLKNLKGQEKNQNNLLSLNLSAMKEKSLGKNQKTFSDFEKSLESLKQVVDTNQQKTGQMLSQKPTAALNGSLNLPNMQNLNEGGKIEIAELDSAAENLIPEVSVKSTKGQASQGSEDNSQLETLFSQYLENDPQTGEMDSSSFVEEMAHFEQPSAAEKAENTASIIKQARAFVDDGGGSMEIHLQPEGLGKVHLKVAVQDGQVNVEMMADNMAAKRALEEGLIDIKSALEGQKLLVDTLKVEMSPDYQKDFTDLQQHMQEQANRDFAEQFLGQFRQEREERMGGMFDAFRNFQRGPQEQDLVLNQRNPYAENGKGRTLNVVA